MEIFGSRWYPIPWELLGAPVISWEYLGALVIPTHGYLWEPWLSHESLLKLLIYRVNICEPLVSYPMGTFKEPLLSHKNIWEPLVSYPIGSL